MAGNGRLSAANNGKIMWGKIIRILDQKRLSFDEAMVDYGSVVNSIW